MKDLIYDYDGFASIMFPPGSPSNGGTCFFATNTCLRECWERHHRWKTRAYELMVNRPLDSVQEHLNRELDELKVPLLHWFDSGDCLPKDQKRILALMCGISQTGRTQNGFTRNVSFWYQANKIQNVRLGLTSETGPIKNGLVVIPDYSKLEIQIYWNGKHTWNCGGGNGGVCGGAGAFAENNDDLFESDCSECLKNQRGCFIQFHSTILKTKTIAE